MNTEIKDEVLAVELQELYLTAKQWLSDLDFLESEERFLRNQLALSASGNILNNLTARLNEVGSARQKLNDSTHEFLNKLEGLIVLSEIVITLQLVEEFISLQTAVAGALNTLKSIKYGLIYNKWAA
ncbi:hypothetical protein IDJ75_15765 [Mucilaginibacter rigui]|uniref:Uncharacterized protein n=1 Tax=Mucilaginibacter rigui TaxID=534635 RepID=A0ABR7X848_9SPHI|nr:hypothetical protein [Mucilaginibacter rigui]MBD1386740.1 hypothetical protein [Mucilaginibacter rigui]